MALPSRPLSWSTEDREGCGLQLVIPEGRPGWPCWEVPSVPRPRRWLHSPALVSEAEDPQIPCCACPFENKLRLELCVPAEHHRVPPPPRAHCVTCLCPWKLQGRPSSWPSCLQGFGGSGEGVSVSKPSVRITVADRRHRSAQQPALRILCSLPLRFPIAFWESTSWLFSVTCHDQESWEEGLAPVFPTDPAWRGQDGTTSFSKLALSPSIESSFPVDQYPL